MKAVAYARFSSDNQRQESITAQLRVIYDYAAKNDINIIKVYTDEARSATTDDRDEFQRMISDMKELKPDLVLVHKLDRFARDRFDAAFYRREIKRSRARLVAVEQDFGEGPEAELMEGILEGFAEYFSRNLSREVKKGHTENAMQGKHCGGIPPLGYDVDKDGKYIINEQEAKAVRLIFKRKLEGRTHKEIMGELSALGYTSKNGRPIGANSLHDILRNEKYNGVFVLRKTSPTNSRKAEDPAKTLRIESGVPRIVDAVIFNRIQEILDKSKNRPQHHEGQPIRYMLTGLIKCGVCGGAMSGDTVRKNPQSPRRGFYKCGKAKRTKECPNSKRYPKEAIESRVLDKISKESIETENIEALADKLISQYNKKSKGLDSRQKELKKALAKLDKEFNNLTNSIALGVDPRFLADKFNEVGRQREMIKKELLSAGSPFDITREMAIKYLLWKQSLAFDRNNEEECMEAIRKGIGEVKVNEDGTVDIELIQFGE